MTVLTLDIIWKITILSTHTYNIADVKQCTQRQDNNINGQFRCFLDAIPVWHTLPHMFRPERRAVVILRVGSVNSTVSYWYRIAVNVIVGQVNLLSIVHRARDIYHSAFLASEP